MYVLPLHYEGALPFVYPQILLMPPSQGRSLSARQKTAVADFVLNTFVGGLVHKVSLWIDRWPVGACKIAFPRSFVVGRL